MAGNRIESIGRAVLAVPGVQPVQARPASRAELERVHAASFLDALIQRTPTEKGRHFRIDSETILNRHTWRAMELSAGAACQAVDAVIEGIAINAFCPVYAGHHAQRQHAAGFCFINSVAIAALHAQYRGLTRVAVLDIDTHAGNGTILSVMDQPGILFAETYQPGYPGSFMPGYRPAQVLRERVTNAFEFRQAWPELLRQVEAFNPQLILVSAGFDAHENDPLGVVKLRDADYVKLATDILRISPRLVACLEGGYDVATTARCAALFVQQMVEAATKDFSGG